MSVRDGASFQLTLLLTGGMEGQGTERPRAERDKGQKQTTRREEKEQNNIYNCCFSVFLTFRYYFTSAGVV